MGADDRLTGVNPIPLGTDRLSSGPQRDPPTSFGLSGLSAGDLELRINLSLGCATSRCDGQRRRQHCDHDPKRLHPPTGPPRAHGLAFRLLALTQLAFYRYRNANAIPVCRESF